MVITPSFHQLQQHAGRDCTPPSRFNYTASCLSHLKDGKYGHRKRAAGGQSNELYFTNWDWMKGDEAGQRKMIAFFTFEML